MANALLQDSITQKFKLDLQQFSLLSAEEEEALFRKLEKNPGDRLTKDKIINANLRLVTDWANKIQVLYHIDNERWWDIFQDGVLGLIRAVEKFDWRRRFKLSTYASWLIRQSMIRAIKNRGRLIRIPIGAQEYSRKFLQIQQELANKFGRRPLPEEMATKMNISLDKVVELQRIINLNNTASLDNIIHDNDNSLLEIIPTEGNDISDEYELNLLKEVLAQALETLDSREREILRLRFGIDDGIPRTLEEVGQKFSLTREAIRQNESKALEKLRAHPLSQQLREFLK